MKYYYITSLILLGLSSCTQNQESCSSFDKNDVKQSIPVLEKYINENPNNLDSLNKMAMNFYKLGNLEKALYYYNIIADANSEYNCVEASKGVCLLLLGKKEDACVSFHKAMKQNCDLNIIEGKNISEYVNENCLK